jgi:hypothetical protein
MRLRFSCNGTNAALDNPILPCQIDRLIADVDEPVEPILVADHVWPRAQLIKQELEDLARHRFSLFALMQHPKQETIVKIHVLVVARFANESLEQLIDFFDAVLAHSHSPGSRVAVVHEAQVQETALLDNRLVVFLRKSFVRIRGGSSYISR